MKLKQETSIYYLVALIALVGLSACNKQADPQPWNSTGPAKSSGLYYYGQPRLSHTSETAFCNNNGGRLEIFGGFAAQADTQFPNRYRTFSTVPNNAQVTVDCSELSAEMTLQSYQLVTRNGSSAYEWADEQVGHSVGVMDSACNIAVEPGIKADMPNRRLIVSITQWPKGGTTTINPLTFPLTVECK